MLDSVTMDNDTLPAVLINPVGLRYHATHHLFEPHLVSLSNIMDDITAIKKAEGTAAKEDLASWDMALLVFDLIRDEFGELYVKEEAAGPVGKLPKKNKANKKP